MTPTDTNIINYINTFSNTRVCSKLNLLYKLLIDVMPTEITQEISYGIPTFKLKGKNLIYFGGAKNHVAIYPGAEVVEKFKSKIEELDLSTSKGTIKFSLEDDLPEELITEIIKFKLARL
jgi:uncharacterized protein YdhG (YjbR/CyaY superfamily)